MIFIIFKGFPESQKNWSFQWPKTCRKSKYFATFQILHLSNPNEWIFTFELSCGHLVMTIIILEGFPESRKNWSLQWPGPFEIAYFCYFPTFAYFSSKRVNFYRLAVLWSYGDDFHHFRRLSRKSKKLKFSTTLALLKNGQFCYLHNFAYFSSKSVIFYTLAVLWSTSDDFHHFQRLSRKTKKIEVFDDRGTVEKANYCYSPNIAYFSSKCVNFYIWLVLWSSGDAFHHFRRLPRKSKKNEVFNHPGPVEKWSILLFSHFSIFFLQISNILYFSCPVLNLVMIFFNFKRFP